MPGKAGKREVVFDMGKKEAPQPGAKQAHHARETLKESDWKFGLLSSELLAAQEAERARISSELHDELGQSLSLLKLRIRFLMRRCGVSDPSFRGELEETLEYVDRVIENVRRLSRGLSPHIVEDLGLAAALKWLVADFGKQHRMATSVRLAAIRKGLSKEQQNHVYRIVQEGLTNIGKHAEAESVRLTVQETKGKLRFTLVDDGNGFDPEKVGSRYTERKGLGMMNMALRAIVLGGSLEVKSQIKGGTRISFSVCPGGQD